MAAACLVLLLLLLLLPLPVDVKLLGLLPDGSVALLVCLLDKLLFHPQALPAPCVINVLSR